jgi:Skp family chaperone for outer membrane proteins
MMADFPGQLGIALCALAAALLLTGCGGGPVGVVDTQRVLNESVRALEYQKQLDDREKQMAAELAVLAPQVSKAELAARRARMLTELGQMQRDLEGQLNQQLGQVAAQVAREQRLRLVITRGPVAYGGRDITQQVIDRLK